MEKAGLLFRDNIKVHFVACETQNQFEAVKAMNVKYTLYSAYPFVERMIFGKPKSPIMIAHDWQRENPYLIPRYIIENSKHCIQDSGLFTLMFGSQKGNKDAALMDKWFNALVEFTLRYSSGATCVEVDCQKVLGVEKAWEYRQKMREMIPNRIINVFHLEDGQKGLDRLIEFSDYLAVSVPELRISKPGTYREDTYRLSCYIKNKKPDMDIHLLGCTELQMLHQNRFCSSSDHILRRFKTLRIHQKKPYIRY
ncbi:MAG: hypothetical protein LBQ60_14915 [Bacteroidales bacterium]|jgi:hypothetical protein|nr:hypothetical protein [Bacteroidales bacterium]